MSVESTRNIVRRMKLSDPIHDAGRTIDTLEFTKPKARLFRLIDSTATVGGDQILALIGDLCDLGPDAVDELDWDDVVEASEIVSELMTKKKKGSRASSPPRRVGGKP